jgi:hypothetical protein
MMRLVVSLLLVLSCASLQAKPRPKQGEPCDAQGRCARHLTCVRYRGVAGAAAPEMTSCERRCHEGNCPAGESCVTIADGPGAVCRPTQK